MKGIKYLTILAVLALVLASGCVTPSDQEGAEDAESGQEAATTEQAVKIGTRYHS